ncbi:helix-turn-helix domain-containing protein [Saccharibacillus brassicae]|uniref:Helix-turn-helix domain-containing protein n=1 Tax=Saccharibacillus brassicae TaxID=2583377 RepID=A0A4Y6UWQ9_SACBS|nr:AraC family transcriptional regulator [Saccharibacillus brassicae]QDH20455.1 helix-turn-helix domain-containing protein [Saccharibacillus brassicae]
MERIPFAYTLTDIRYEEISPGPDRSGEGGPIDGLPQGERPTGQAQARRASAGAELWVVTGGTGSVHCGETAWPLARGRLLLGPLGGVRAVSAGPAAEAGRPDAAAGAGGAEAAEAEMSEAERREAAEAERKAAGRSGPAAERGEAAEAERKAAGRSGPAAERGEAAGMSATEAAMSLPQLQAAGAEPLTLYRLAFCAADRSGAPLPPGEALPFVGATDFAPFSFCAERAQKLHERRGETGGAAALERQIAFQELLLAAVRQRESASRAGTGGSAALDVREAVRRSIARIDREYREPFTVESLAASAGIGRWTYTNLFKEATGSLPLDYLNRVRIGQAKQLLLATEDRLGEIAQRVGFSSEYYFSRRFKREAGLSPGQYRRLHRREVRVFAPYLEDALLALGIVPIAQYSHSAWGVQAYLPLEGVPAFDVADGTREDLLRLKPELLLFDDGFERWRLDRLSGVAPSLLLEQPGEAWADKLRGTAALFGREAEARHRLRRYDEEVRDAGSRLAAMPGGSASRGSVACLRISAQQIRLYAQHSGYTGPLLYGELGLKPPGLLRHMPEAQRSLLLRPDELAQVDADHLFVIFDKSDNRHPGDERRLLEHPCWRTLPAVQAGRVYETDFFAWMNYGILAHGRKIRDVLETLL